MVTRGGRGEGAFVDKLSGRLSRFVLLANVFSEKNSFISPTPQSEHLSLS